MPIPCHVCRRKVPKPRAVNVVRICRRCLMCSPLPLRQEHTRNFKAWRAAGYPLTTKACDDMRATWQQILHFARTAYFSTKGTI